MHSSSSGQFHNIHSIISLSLFRVPGSSTVGTDINNDGIPDIPLRYELDDSQSVVQFPLGFCPSEPGGVVRGKKRCFGSYGIVIKEWEAITRV